MSRKNPTSSSSRPACVPTIGQALGLALAVCCSAFGLATTSPAEAQPSDYSLLESWLCRPGQDDACAQNIDSTVVAADGTLTREAFKPNAEAPVDCFYVYPTVSTDPGGNSDMVANDAELRVIRNQFARFGSVCRTFAPIYRQITLTALRARIAGQTMEFDRALGYADALAAWKHYLEHDNDGRGFVLIGHSQGSGVLAQLIGSEIDGKPVQKQMVSALLLGTSLPVDEGKDTGSFKHIPVCRADSQTGCVIAYASFRDTIPPPENSRFGRVSATGSEAVCANPAALRGGAGELRAYLPASGSLIGSSDAPSPWVLGSAGIETPFVSVPGLLSAECLKEHGASYLSVTVNGDPKDPRTDDIAGDVVIGESIAKDWGLHLIDVDLAMGNLLDVVAAQSKAFAASR